MKLIETSLEDGEVREYPLESGIVELMEHVHCPEEGVAWSRQTGRFVPQMSYEEDGLVVLVCGGRVKVKRYLGRRDGWDVASWALGESRDERIYILDHDDLDRELFQSCSTTFGALFHDAGGLFCPEPILDQGPTQWIDAVANAAKASMTPTEIRVSHKVLDRFQGLFSENSQRWAWASLALPREKPYRPGAACCGAPEDGPQCRC